MEELAIDKFGQIEERAIQTCMVHGISIEVFQRFRLDENGAPLPPDERDRQRAWILDRDPNYKKLSPRAKRLINDAFICLDYCWSVLEVLDQGDARDLMDHTKPPKGAVDFLVWFGEGFDLTANLKK